MILSTIEDILKEFAPRFAAKVHDLKRSMGVKHKRTKAPVKNKVKLRMKDGMNVLSLMASKGDMMTHKGKGGKGQDSRVEKPFINEAGEQMLPELADKIANETGDYICYQLVK